MQGIYLALGLGLTAGMAGALAVLLLQARARRLAATRWDEHPDRLPGVERAQGLGPWGRDPAQWSAHDEMWSDYWWARIPTRTDDGASASRLVDLSPVSLISVPDNQTTTEFESQVGRIRPVRIAVQVVGPEQAVRHTDGAATGN
jgi:hypothetical protein